MKTKIRFIYLTTNLINNKKYIGQHTGYLDDNYLGSGILLTQAIEKYGRENFSREIIEICNSQEELDLSEKYWIDYYNAIEDDNYYNLQEGGQGGDGWRAYRKWAEQHPEELQEKYKLRGERLQQWVKDYPEENQQHIQTMLTAAHQYYKNNPNIMLEHMKEVNLAKEQWQKEHPEQYAQQVHSWILAGSKANSKKVRCITTNQVFDSISAAARFYNTSQPNISKVLKGERHYAGQDATGTKLQWEWYQPAAENVTEL